MVDREKPFIPGKTRVLYGGVDLQQPEKDAIIAAVEANWWGLGTQVQGFEKELAEKMGVANAIFVNSGSSALELAVRSLKLTKGSEVIVPACTFPTPIASIIREGLIPVVADIEPESYFISPDSVKSCLTENTKAILMVYVAGAVGQLEEVLAIANENKLHVIEDNCDGLGGTWKGKMLGSFGDVSAISTHAAHIIATGQGGVLFTNNPELAKRANSLRNWGRISNFEEANTQFPKFPPEYSRYIYDELGSNYQPTEINAAMGRVQLRRLEEFKAARQRNFGIIYEKLSHLQDKLILPKSNENSDPCWYTFPITLKEGVSRAVVLHELDQANIEWRPILAGNIALQPAFKPHIKEQTPLPVANSLIYQGFWVSVHPIHEPEVMEFVGDTISEAVSKTG